MAQAQTTPRGVTPSPYAATPKGDNSFIVPNDQYGNPDYRRTRFIRCRACKTKFNLPLRRSVCARCEAAAKQTPLED